jgi:hypothetical protein
LRERLGERIEGQRMILDVEHQDQLGLFVRHPASGDKRSAGRKAAFEKLGIELSERFAFSGLEALR